MVSVLILFLIFLVQSLASSPGSRLDTPFFRTLTDSSLCGESSEGDVGATVSCTAGKIICTVPFASFGTPTGSCGSYAYSACNQVDSIAYVTNACVGRSSCTVMADSGSIVCAASSKWLYFEISCCNVPTSQPSAHPSGQPTVQPTVQPTTQPSGQPSSQPASKPSMRPSSQPTARPSRQPTSQPSRQPSAQPTQKPSTPTGQPTRQPTRQPTSQPSAHPSSQPIVRPTSCPTVQPSARPSVQPSSQPSCQPTGQPNSRPTGQPSRQPTTQPTAQPSRQPTSQPSTQPTVSPTGQPSRQPTQQPTGQPSRKPSSQPSRQPSRQPTGQPTRQPTSQPSRQPTRQPSAQPSRQPTSKPTGQPSSKPSQQPTSQPSSVPTGQPSKRPSTQPTGQPTRSPTGQPSRQPTRQPTGQPTRQPTSQPSRQPTRQPTSQPSRHPTSQPSCQPSTQPSVQPSSQPSSQPSAQPSGEPTSQPTNQPTRQPTGQPSRQPSTQPTGQPTRQPTSQPSRQPTQQPTAQPSRQPTSQPSQQPTRQPTSQPTRCPTGQPTMQPTRQPISVPTGQPSCQPTMQPTTQPTSQPSGQPSGSPTCQPTCQPSAQPTGVPSGQPTSQPSMQPSIQPTAQPSRSPTGQPSRQPSCQPTSQPSQSPSMQPTSHPSGQPTSQPSGEPTGQPSSLPTCIPTFQPTSSPTCQPSSQPSSIPSGQPTSRPTHSHCPTGQPSSVPSSHPTRLVFADITIVNATVTGSSITVYTELTEQIATVYCGAFYSPPYAEAKLTSLADITLQKHSAMATNYSVNVTLAPVYRSSHFRVFCYTVGSANGSPLPLRMTQHRFIDVYTDCCKTIAVSWRVSNLFEGLAVATGFTISLDALPLDDIEISITTLKTDVNQSSTSPVVKDTVFPSVWKFSRKSTSKKASFALIAGSAGTCVLVVNVTGASSQEFKVVYVKGNRLPVLQLGQEPPSPRLNAAVYADDGSQVSVSFDAASNRAGLGNSNFQCSLLFDMKTDPAATCQWQDDYSLFMYSSGRPGTSLPVGSRVLLRPKVLGSSCPVGLTASLCSTWAWSNSSNVTIEGPANPVLPTVVVSAPEVLSSCSVLALDSTASFGSAGRAWTSRKYQVFGTGSLENIAAVEAYVNIQLGLYPDVPLVVDKNLLDLGQIYTFILTLCNFFGVCGTGSASVMISPSPYIPVATILGPPVRTIRRGDTLSLSALYYSTNCDGDLFYTGLDAAWTVLQLDYEVPGLKSVSVDKKAFLLNPYSLKLAQQYTVQMEVTHLSSGDSIRASVSVVVASASLVVVIAGGDSRSIRCFSSFRVDASASYDPDLNSAVEDDTAGLLFHWDCQQALPTFSLDCPVRLPGDVTASLLVASAPNSLFVNSTAKLTATVSKDVRSTTKSILLTIMDVHSPLVSIAPPDVGVADINTGVKYVITGYVETVRPCTAYWSVDDPSVPLATTSLTPVVVKAERTIVSATVVPIAFPADALPSRTALSFTLTCGASTSSISITTNGPPTLGAFSVLPRRGFELVTPFTFTATKWVDPQIPITYEFGFSRTVSFSPLMLRGSAEASSHVGRLPSGLSSADRRVTCYVRVADSLSASVTATALVYVNQSSESVLASAVDSQVKASAGNTDAIKQILSVSTSAFTRVNCTGVKHCHFINRQPCEGTTGMCGPCLSGFVGDLGDGNTLCASIAALSSASPVMSKPGVACNYLSDCGVWDYCTRGYCEEWDVCLPGVCVQRQKSCGSDCHHRGSCVFVAADDSSRPVETCLESDATCVSKCVCNSTFFGQFCEVDVAGMLLKRQQRDRLLQVVHNLTSSENPSAAATSNVLNLLDLLSLDPVAMSPDKLDELHSACNSLLSVAVRLEFPVDAVNKLLRIIDNLVLAKQFTDTAEEATSTGDSFTDRVSSSLAEFGKLMLSQHVVGESPVKLVGASYTMGSAVEVSGGGFVAQSVQSTFASATGELPATVSLPPMLNPNASSASVKYATVVTKLNVFPNSTRSSLFSLPVTLTAFGDVGTEDREVTFVIPVFNNSYVEDFQETFSTTCAFNVSESFTHKCHKSGFVIQHNCTGDEVILQSKCPLVVGGYNCTALTESGSGSCRLTSTSDSTITCVCTLFGSNATQTAAGGRRRLASNSISSTQVAAIGSFIAGQFSGTIVASVQFNSLADVQRVLTVLVLFATLWAGGLFFLFTCAWRRHANIAKSPMKKAALEKKKQSIDGTNPNAAREFLVNYIGEVFPAAFRDKPKLLRLKDEIMNHHRYLVLFSSGGSQNDWHRILTGVQLLSVQTMLMFLLALLYDVQAPDDDGSCVFHKTMSDCLQRRSMFDKKVTYCSWNGSDDSCAFQSPHISGFMIAFLSVLISMITAVVNYPLDYLFDLIAAPTADSVKAQQAESMAAKAGRRLSNVARKASIVAAGAITATVAAARSKAERLRRISTIGFTTRYIPDSTQEAHDLALSSVPAIKQRASQLMQHRNSLLVDSDRFVSRKVSHGDLDAEETTAVALATASQPPILHRFASKIMGSGKVGIPPPVPASGAGMPPVPTPNELFVRLVDEIERQRHYLAPSDIDRFDDEWGMDAEGEFLSTSSSQWCGMRRHLFDAKQNIRKEIAFVVKESNKRVDKLSLATDAHTGLEILHLFVLDLLGRETPIARIFESKSAEDFRHERVVTRSTKGLAWFVVIAVNIFFIYYTLLRGLVKGLAWQKSFLLGCLMQLFVEIMLNETLECIWVNFLVPDLVSADIVAAEEEIKGAIDRLCGLASFKKNIFLDAPSYLFVSTNVAKKYPQLMESIIVQAYQSHLPGQLSKKWKFGSSMSINRTRGGMRAFTVIAVMVSTLQILGASPFVLQRIVIRLTQPWIYAGLALIFVKIFKNPTILVVILLALVIVFGVLGRYLLTDYRNSKKNSLADVCPDTTGGSSHNKKSSRRGRSHSGDHSSRPSSGRSGRSGRSGSRNRSSDHLNLPESFGRFSEKDKETDRDPVEGRDKEKHLSTASAAGNRKRTISGSSGILMGRSFLQSRTGDMYVDSKDDDESGRRAGRCEEEEDEDEEEEEDDDLDDWDEDVLAQGDGEISLGAAVLSDSLYESDDHRRQRDHNNNNNSSSSHIRLPRFEDDDDEDDDGLDGRYENGHNKDGSDDEIIMDDRERDESGSGSVGRSIAGSDGYNHKHHSEGSRSGSGSEDSV